MSEGSKMGLFGSKEDKKEPATDETTKQDSPDRYAPYCIDSDSETYDTEALSIMDINDIIGVQTGQATESTLESEIAALTEIITDSKGDTICDTMNDLHTESSDIKFNEELLTEFTSLSSSENPMPTTSKEGFDQGSITIDAEAKNLDDLAGDKYIPEDSNEIEDSLSKVTSEIKTDSTTVDNITTRDVDATFHSLEQNSELSGEKAELRSESEAKEESSLSHVEKSIDDIPRNKEGLVTEADKLLLNVDAATSEITSSDTETLTQGATESSEDASAPVEMGSDVEKKEDDKDLSKNDAKSAPENNANLLQDVGSTLESESEEKEAVDENLQDEKSRDVLTNLGSTSKSLQLIGEAYISEDSQETDEEDECAKDLVTSVSLEGAKNRETVEKNDEPLQTGSSDNVSSDSQIDELKINAIADTPENAVEKCNLDNQDRTSLEDDNEPDNTKEIPLNQTDNHENSSQNPNVDSEINVHNKNDQVIEEDKSIDLSLSNEKCTDKSNEIDKVTPLSAVSDIPDISTASTTPLMRELVEIQDKPSPELEQLEDISSNCAAETIDMVTEDAEIKSETNQKSDEMPGKTLDQAVALQEGIETSEADVNPLNTNTQAALEVDDSSPADPEPLEESEALPSVVSKTELENTTDMDSEIQPENTEVTKSVESPTPVHEQDNSVPVESNVDEELPDSQSNEESASNSQHSTVEDKFGERDSESSMLPVEVDTNSEDKDNEYATSAMSDQQTIFREEQSKEISDSVEQLLETTQGNTEKINRDISVTEVHTQLATEVTDNKNSQEKEEDSCVRKMILSIRKAEQEKDSEPSRVKIDSPILEGSCLESSSDLPTDKEDPVIEECKERVDEVENLETELNQAASASSMENNAAISNFTETNKLEETVEECLDLERGHSTEIDSVELATAKLSDDQLEGHSSSVNEVLESEILSSITTEDIPGSTMETASENITFANTESRSPETNEIDSSKDDLNEAEVIQKPLESQQIVETEKVESGTRVEFEISRTDNEEVAKIQACHQTQQLEELQSISGLSVDIEEEQVKDTSDNHDAEIEESRSIAEPRTLTIAGNTTTVAESEFDSEVATVQGPLGHDSHSESKPKEDKVQVLEHEGVIDVLDKQQELDIQSESSTKNDESQSQKPSQSNEECGSNDVKQATKSEMVSDMPEHEEQDDSNNQLEMSEDKADSQIIAEKSLPSVSCDELEENLIKTESKADENLSENQAAEPCDSQIGTKDSQEMESVSIVLTDATKSLEEEERLQEVKVFSTKPINDKDSDDTINIPLSGENLELGQSLSGTNEIENDSEGTLLNLINETAPLLLQNDDLIESEVKIDEVLQCEPIEDLEKLAVVADEILIDELANSVLKDAEEPLENINNLEILPDSNLSMSTIVSSEQLESTTVTNLSSEIKDQPVSILDEINETCFIGNLNETPRISHGANYITDVIISSTNIDSIQLADNTRDMGTENVTADEFERSDQVELVTTSENLALKDTVPIDQSIRNMSEACKLAEENLVLDKNIEIDLPLKQEEAKLIECAVLRACDAKIDDLPDEVLFDAENAEQTDALCSEPADADTSQQSSEFSELECAVKFLQESEEQTIDSPLLLSPKMAEEIVEENSEQSKSCLFLSETQVCREPLELPAELEEITPDSIAISEAEIISEAAKLENERKLKIAAQMSQTSPEIEKFDVTEKSPSENSSDLLKGLLTISKAPSWQEKKSEENSPSTSKKSETTQMPKLAENIIHRSDKIPKISILEERLKEPPKIEIPVPEGSPKISDTPTTPKTNLLIQRDSRMYQKMLESPKGGDRSEPKIADTPRKDSDKHDFENVGSPRIILKIAKSAIADCGEPRSPKSPKIRSAANSPNPEDSPGQKLGKIKLKLSKGGHPSIISNENFDETAQRHTEAILSPSHIGMKIKLSKTGDASIIQPDKHDSVDEPRESKHKFEEASPKRIESPLGMKIKLSKTGDPSIVQQDSKESTSKRKDKSDIGQEIPKRTDSPIGMKIKLSKSGDASIIQPEKQETLEDATYKDKFEIGTDIPKRTESPIGMKIKLSKTGDASIISSESCEDSSSKSRDKSANTQDIPKRTDSPLGMKFKLSKSGGASIIQPEKPENFDDFKDKAENIADITKRVESPIGMKIKLLKTGDASIIHPDKQESEEHRESIVTKPRDKSETQEIQKRTDSPLGMRIKVTKTGEASVVPPEEFKESSMVNTDNFDVIQNEPQKRNESPIGMKIKLSKSGDASIIHPEKQESLDDFKDSRGSSSVHQEGSKSSESLGMKIKLSKTGDASIIHPEISPESKDAQSKRTEKLQSSAEGSKRTDSPLGMKIKLSKTGDASIIEPDKKEKLTTKQKEKLTNISEASPKRKEMEYPLEMKIKLSKTGHPTIIANEKQEPHAEIHAKSKEYSESGQSTHHKRTGSMSPTKDSQLRIFKTGHSTIIQSNRSEVTIEPIQMLSNKPESSLDTSAKCKEVTISPIELKKSKLEAKLSHILPEVTIQPVMSGEQKQIILDKKSSTISRQQMSVINQEISITQVSPSKPADLSMSGKLKEILRKNATNSPGNSDCEIIEHRPELIIVNENSNSSQDIMIIEEVKAPLQEVKIPRKRGRPKRSTLPPGQPLMRQIIPQDPLALDNMQPSASAEHRESDRPKRTCRNQKSYAPPKRGRGRGRGKRKMDRVDCAISKIPRLHEDPLTAIERSTMSLIAPLQPIIISEPTTQTSELYKALKQSPAERKRLMAEAAGKHGFPDAHKKLRLEPEPGTQLASELPAVSIIEEHSTIATTSVATSATKAATISEMLHLAQPATVQQTPEKLFEAPKPEVHEAKNVITEITTTEHQNWLTPSIKLPEVTGKTEAISMVQVMDEETRMSAESNSRSQTPARNISIPVVETAINEESQGSVLSTATTESEKVKVKNRRMEINFDPDEGPFTVDKIAEYEWPPDRKGDTFMIQEQISQYLGVKSFKRKYPDLKRRMVEMEERNFLRENCLVSEAMCDMGLTAICSTEVLDIMCSDFPDQYEEYRKHMREKQAKEHSKKQKELTAAANAERNRIDLAEMAVQSALSWNVNFNKARKESRKYSLDLQSFTIHVPKKQLKVDQTERRASNYPVALIPGQYTDYYREYTPAELRYYPLNTVLYGPMRPNERKFDSQSEGSQSDSDSDSSSDDSSSSSSEGTQDTEESQSTVDEVDMEIAAHKEDNKNLKCKMCLKHLNKHGKAEVLIQCGTCNGNVHPSCIDLTLDMVPHIQGYSWQCTDCKTCVQCHNPADEDKMLFCDMCDRGYHIYCVGLRRVPQGRWHCRECAVCASCGLRQPGGANSDRNSVAQWQHEYKKGERNTRVYVSTLCVPCSKLWRKGRYCPHCSRCHSAQRLDLEANLVHCSACDKYLHLGCVENRSGTLDRKNYICECCSTPGQQLSRLLMSKNFKT